MVKDKNNRHLKLNSITHIQRRIYMWYVCRVDHIIPLVQILIAEYVQLIKLPFNVFLFSAVKASIHLKTIWPSWCPARLVVAPCRCLPNLFVIT